jgi:hypothetical protein
MKWSKKRRYLIQGNASRREPFELNRIWASAEAQYSWLEILKCLAWRVVKERGENDSSSCEKFWDPSRARDILRDAGVFDRLEKQTARYLFVKALAESRDVVRDAERYPIPFLYLAWTLVQLREGL